MRANGHLSPASDFREQLSEDINVINMPRCQGYNRVRDLNISHLILPRITYAFHINIHKTFLLHKILFIVEKVSLDY